VLVLQPGGFRRAPDDRRTWRSSGYGSQPGRGLVSAARATAARGDQTYRDYRRDHHENSDCDPGVSAERHLILLSSEGSFIDEDAAELDFFPRRPELS